MEKVQELSEKGDKLTWEDVNSYDGESIGFGLYIMMYPIDDKYKVMIGGTDPNKKPMYIYLVYTNSKEDQKRIDIRYGDINKFIRANKVKYKR